MKFLRITALLALLLASAAGVAWFMRDRLVDQLLQPYISAQLSQLLGARVEIKDAGYGDGKLRIGRGAVGGAGLPFARLEFNDARTAVDWRKWREFAANPLHIEVASVDFIRAENADDSADRPAGAGAKVRLPTVDILAANFTCRADNEQEWRVRDTAARLRHENGKWALSARGGVFEAPGWPVMKIDRLSAEHEEGTWRISSFALSEEKGGAFAGSAVVEDGALAGEFSWQDMPLEEFLPAGAGRHFSARSSGDAQLERGELRGGMKLTAAETKHLPALVKLASIFTGEDYSSVPWQSARFDFVRGTDGSVSFGNLLAVSPKGLALRGSGKADKSALSADLQLGVRREGRPWLVAFMPVLFRSEKEGYLWTSVKVGGTPTAPTEDLTPRIVAALAAAPATEAVDAAAEIPAAAAEAAGGLLRKLLDR